METTFLARFVRGMAATSLATLANLAFGFINVGIAARFIPREEFGIFLLIQTIVFSLIMIGDLGLNITVVKFISDAEHSGRDVVASTVLALRTALLALGILMVLLLKAPLTHLLKFEALSAAYYYIPILFVFESYNMLFSSLLQGCQNFKKMALAQVLLSTVNVTLITGTVALLGLGMHGLVAARLAALLVAILYQRSVLGLKLSRPDREVARSIMGFGLFLGLNNILSFVFMRIDTLIIGAITNPVGVALYGTATKLPDAFRQMFESFRSVFFPNMAELFGRNRVEEAETVLNNALRLLCFLSFFLTLAIFTFKEAIVTLLFSSRYLDSAPVLPLLMLATSIGLIGNVLGTSLVAAGHPRLPVLINVVDAAVCVTANLLLIPRFGIIGAAYAAVIARTASNPVNVYFLKRSGINLKVSSFLKPAAVCAICWWASSLFAGASFRMLALLCYPLLSLCFLVITTRDLAGLKRAVSMGGDAS